ncbi:MAG: sigma 54-interacting transcriptional regulator [Myxococcales bacterium]|nr:sigma 54-interacting transcriptional regulator [Myxococcales bacterium]
MHRPTTWIVTADRAAHDIPQIGEAWCRVVDATEVDELVASVAAGRPTLVIVDAEHPDALAVVERVASGCHVFLSCEDVDLAVVGPALDAGARGLVARGDEHELIARIRDSHDPGLDRWRRTHAAEIIGDDLAIAEALDAVRAVADTEATVLIGGESGTGKELIARAVHRASRRASGPFVAVNCAAIPEQLVEAELFGHGRGAFTGAVAAREGRIMAADGGTLLLDEIGDMPLPVQAKLLRVLQDRQVTPVGCDRPVAVDVRIVASTHRDLPAMVEAGTFRADLYYRLSVMDIELPPLRARRGDLLSLAVHHLRTYNAVDGRATSGLDRPAIEALLAHAWPGNVRELANTIERAVVMRRAGAIGVRDLKLNRRLAQGTPARGTPALPAVVTPVAAPPGPDAESLNLKAALESVERSLIEAALERASGNRSEAAALLGLNRTTLVEKLRKRA